MKNLYCSVLFILVALNVSAQTYFQDDFEGTTLNANNEWITQVLVPSTSNLDWIHDEFSGNFYAEMNNYNGTENEEVETWLFTPVIDLSNSNSPILNFDNLKRFAGQDLLVLVSTNFDSSSPPAASTWMDITDECNMDADVDSWDYGNSGDVDITPYKSDKFSLAFRYQGGASNGSLYQIDNITIIEGNSVSVLEIDSPDFDLYPNPVADHFTVVMPGKNELIISDVLGNKIKVVHINDKEIIHTNDMQQGIYFVRIGNAVQKIIVK